MEERPVAALAAGCVGREKVAVATKGSTRDPVTELLHALTAVVETRVYLTMLHRTPYSDTWRAECM